MKKNLLVSILFLFFGLIPGVHAQFAQPEDAASPNVTPQVLPSPSSGFTALAPIPGLTDTSNTAVVNSTSLANFFNNLYKYVIGLAAVLAVIMIIWGGLEISTQDSISKQSAGKEKIQQAILGLVLVLSPVLVFSIINPNILNLSLNLPPLETKSGSPVQTGGGTGTQTSSTDAATTAAAAGGCTVTGTLLKTAICPTQKAAQDFATACSAAGGLGNVPFFTTDHKATCGTGSAGPYGFIDTSTSGFSFTGIFNAITGYSHYEPLANAPGVMSNGNTVMQFASACTADGGTTCMSTIKIPIPSSICGHGSAYCWAISLSCTDGNTGAGGCSKNPQFTVIP